MEVIMTETSNNDTHYCSNGSRLQNAVGTTCSSVKSSSALLSSVDASHNRLKKNCSTLIGKSSEKKKPIELSLNRSQFDVRIYTDVQSNGLTGRIAKYQESTPVFNRSQSTSSLYKRPGQFPVVHLKRMELPSRVTNKQLSMTWIAPPEKSLFYGNTLSGLLRSNSIVSFQKSDDELSRENRPIIHPPPTNDTVPTRSVLDVLKEISRKRINNDEEGGRIDLSFKKYCSRGGKEIDSVKTNMQPSYWHFSQTEHTTPIINKKHHEQLVSASRHHLALAQGTEKSPEQMTKTRLYNYNNDIVSSLSSSLIYANKRKLYDIPLKKSSPLADEFLQCSKKHCQRLQDHVEKCNIYNTSQVFRNTPLKRQHVVNSPVPTRTPKVPSPIYVQQQPTNISKRLTLFNKGSEKSEDYTYLKQNDVVLGHKDDIDSNAYAAVEFIKPKKGHLLTGTKHPLLQRTQNSKLALMLSGLRGEAYHGDNELNIAAVEAKTVTEIDKNLFSQRNEGNELIKKHFSTTVAITTNTMDMMNTQPFYSLPMTKTLPPIFSFSSSIATSVSTVTPTSSMVSSELSGTAASKTASVVSTLLSNNNTMYEYTSLVRPTNTMSAASPQNLIVNVEPSLLTATESKIKSNTSSGTTNILTYAHTNMSMLESEKLNNATTLGKSSLSFGDIENIESIQFLTKPNPDTRVNFDIKTNKIMSTKEDTKQVLTACDTTRKGASSINSNAVSSSGCNENEGLSTTLIPRNRQESNEYKSSHSALVLNHTTATPNLEVPFLNSTVCTINESSKPIGPANPFTGNYTISLECNHDKANNGKHIEQLAVPTASSKVQTFGEGLTTSICNSNTTSIASGAFVFGSTTTNQSTTFSNVGQSSNTFSLFDVNPTTKSSTINPFTAIGTTPTTSLSFGIAKPVTKNAFSFGTTINPTSTDTKVVKSAFNFGTDNNNTKQNAFNLSTHMGINNNNFSNIPSAFSFCSTNDGNATDQIINTTSAKTTTATFSCNSNAAINPFSCDAGSVVSSNNRFRSDAASVQTSTLTPSFSCTGTNIQGNEPTTFTPINNIFAPKSSATSDRPIRRATRRLHKQ